MISREEAQNKSEALVQIDQFHTKRGSRAATARKNKRREESLLTYKFLPLLSGMNFHKLYQSRHTYDEAYSHRHSCMLFKDFMLRTSMKCNYYDDAVA